MYTLKDCLVGFAFGAVAGWLSLGLTLLVLLH